MIEEQTPPHNIEVEQYLLGALLVNNDAFRLVDDLITAEAFYEPVHGRIYEAIKHDIDQDRLVTPVTLKPLFEHDPDLEPVGGMSYIVRMAASAPTIIAAPDYAKHIVEHHIRRQIIETSEGICLEAFENNSLDIDDFLNDIEEEFINMRPQGDRKEIKPVNSKSIFDKTIKSMKDAHDNPGLVGISTGLHWLDERLGGWRKQRSYILAGRPGMAKTAMALFFMLRAAEAGKNGLFFSLEMPDEQLGFRLLSCTAMGAGKPIQYAMAEKGNLTPDEQVTYNQMSGLAKQLPFHVIDRGGLKLSQIRLLARRHKRKLEKEGKNLDIIFIDFLQIIQADKTYRGQKTQEISEITMGLKNLSKELNCPVITLSQLSREVEKRDNKRPILSDLRDSGSIEQDADDVLFLYRDEYYLEKEEIIPNTNQEQAYLKSKNKIEIITAKQRGGPTGRDTFYCDMGTNFFRDLRSDE